MMTIHFERFILLQFFLPYFCNNHNNNEKKNGTGVTIGVFISIPRNYFFVVQIPPEGCSLSMNTNTICISHSFY